MPCVVALDLSNGLEPPEAAICMSLLPVGRNSELQPRQPSCASQTEHVSLAHPLGAEAPVFTSTPAHSPVLALPAANKNRRGQQGAEAQTGTACHHLGA